MTFSITIPAYKSKFLREAIMSCLSQTFHDFELIIVNDCSPDDIDSIVASFNDSRIRYFVNEKNYGALNVVDNWNKCLDYVKGEYVICMGDDDRLIPCCLEEYVKLIKKHPDLDVYHAKTEVIDEHGNLIEIQDSQPDWESAYSILYHKCHCNRLQFIGDWLFRVNTLRNHNGFFKLPYAIFSDNISAVRAAINGGVANTQHICFQYRQHSQTISNNPQARELAYASKLAYDWFETFLLKTPVDPEDLKYRSLLLKMDLRHYVYGIINYLVRKDILENGKEALHYWDTEFEKLGMNHEEYKAISSEFKPHTLKKKLLYVKSKLLK